jgi:hypothetical protein
MTDLREKASIDLKIARADAIHNYVGVEQSLSGLLAILLGISNDQAGIIFFNIIASRTRDKIIEGLLEKRFGNRYERYWHGIPGTSATKREPGLFALLQQLATTRNFIVHWAIAVNVGSGAITESLIPPNVWGFKDDQRSLSIQDLEQFSQKASFVSRSLNMFNLIVGGQWPAGLEQSPWPDIFQQPCTYPPSDTHPLSPNYKAPGTPCWSPIVQVTASIAASRTR